MKAVKRPRSKPKHVFRGVTDFTSVGWLAPRTLCLYELLAGYRYASNYYTTDCLMNYLAKHVHIYLSAYRRALSKFAND
jgi:hypothetical protein